ncbi:hypothetical protein TREMEDRAFT_65770 [Tremella mesenterica DSM 1558]|uniref:uncharacterized protein n=1 Tax=Tremella mesenterica (strain ATCC 24925 / CBS 8224 / DSM 1558 / NBRC 9311 / NRRL Y-6157 / RJB 2259-6 / UBC 559-6) TaxID=578456 RepID=UPI00032C5A5B|nr:uncharacterized protein TREMEDRAFT_65770 [Tremella mesenterica DSM 1558]EIW66168.1 hypothetical protein TREMEDRAFT_65770 [Tremella mesenterica DSM 1558]
MFAPAPRSHFIPRTYTTTVHPHTTARKKTNKENDLPTKTPSRAGPTTGVLKTVNTGIRAGLGTTVQRDRNIVHVDSHEDIGPKRLFQSTNKPQPSDSMKPSKSLTFSQHIHPVQHTKTPGPKQKSLQQNRLRTPGPGIQVKQPDPAPLPSAARTRRRSRQSISLTPAQAEKSYQTPAPSHKWEDEISLGSIEEGLEGLQMEGEGKMFEVTGEEDVEYMPPKMQEIPYSPPWGHVDYVSQLERLASLPPLWSPSDDTSFVMPDLDFQIERLDVPLNLEDEPLDEPEFKNIFSSPICPPVKPIPAKNSLTGVKRPGAVPIRKPAGVTSTKRPLTSISKLDKAPTMRKPLSIVTRPISQTKLSDAQISRPSSHKPMRQNGPSRPITSRQVTGKKELQVLSDPILSSETYEPETFSLDL